MADALGLSSMAAFRKDPGENGGGIKTYPHTPIDGDLGATSLVPFTNEGLTKAIEHSVDPALLGSHAAPPGPIILKDCSGPIGGRLRYNGWARMMLCATGFEYPKESPAFLYSGQGTKVVTDATNATPIVITTSTVHGYVDGDGVRVASVGGNTAANGDWTINVLTTTTFELNDSSGNGAYTSGGTTQKFDAFSHLFELDDALQDQGFLAGERNNFHANDRKVRRGQVGLAKTVEDWIFGSCMVNKMTINGNPSEVGIVFDLTPYELYRGDYSSDTWTVASGSTSQGLFQQTVVELARRTDTPGSMTTIAASGFELVVDNPLKTDDRTTASSPNIIIPVRDNFKSVTLKLDRPRYSSVDGDNTLIGYFAQGQEMSAKITITGALIGGSAYYMYRFCLPSIYATGPLGPANIEGPGPLTQEWNFRAYRPITTDPFAASYYDSITVLKDSELVIVHHNIEGCNYLREL